MLFELDQNGRAQGCQYGDSRYGNYGFPDEQGPEQWDIEMLDILEEVFMLDELEPCMIEPKPQAAPMEKQESFPGDPLDPTKLL